MVLEKQLRIFYGHHDHIFITTKVLRNIYNRVYESKRFRDFQDQYFTVKLNESDLHFADIEYQSILYLSTPF
jgi:hypothetical protein